MDSSNNNDDPDSPQTRRPPSNSQRPPLYQSSSVPRTSHGSLPRNSSSSSTTNVGKKPPSRPNSKPPSRSGSFARDPSDPPLFSGGKEVVVVDAETEKQAEKKQEEKQDQKIEEGQLGNNDIGSLIDFEPPVVAAEVKLEDKQTSKKKKSNTKRKEAAKALNLSIQTATEIDPESTWIRSPFGDDQKIQITTNTLKGESSEKEVQFAKGSKKTGRVSSPLPLLSPNYASVNAHNHGYPIENPSNYNNNALASSTGNLVSYYVQSNGPFFHRIFQSRRPGSGAHDSSATSTRPATPANAATRPRKEKNSISNSLYSRALDLRVDIDDDDSNNDGTYERFGEGKIAPSNLDKGAQKIERLVILARYGNNLSKIAYSSLLLMTGISLITLLGMYLVPSSIQSEALTVFAFIAFPVHKLRSLLYIGILPHHLNNLLRFLKSRKVFLETLAFVFPFVAYLINCINIDLNSLLYNAATSPVSKGVLVVGLTGRTGWFYSSTGTFQVTPGFINDLGGSFSAWFTLLLTECFLIFSSFIISFIIN